MIFKDYDYLQNYDLKNFEEKVKIYKELLSKFNRIHNLT
ncbi:16S rRNA (guanine(527)-N(7))-methyltransferase RsmG, partial [Campylobacter jejuni]